MAQLRYVTPFAFLALVPLGGWLGGAWTFAAAAATPLLLSGFDALFGEERVTARTRTGSHWLPRIYVLLQLAVNAWAAASAARPATTLLEAAGLALSAGVTTGVFGFVAAHELVHSRAPRERALGLTLLGSVFYMHFRIAHVYGHHRRAATRDDPATARLGEALYAFLVRSVAGQFREAWSFEAQRLRRTGRVVFGPANRMVRYLAIEGLFLFALIGLSWKAAAFTAAVAVIAVLLLESFNYVAHYGLSRRIAADGRFERLRPEHSWNSARRMNNAALFNMGRHTDHHRVMTRSYERLDPVAGSAVLPSGYAAALVTALIPPLWRRIMDDRAKAAMAVPSA
jgi:alkane 1-monooxygenase